MFAGWVCKVGLGAMLLVLGQCKEVVAAKTPTDRAREIAQALVAGRFGAVRRELSREIKEARVVVALREHAAAGVDQVRRLVKSGCASLRRAREYALFVLPARVEAAWNEFALSIIGEKSLEAGEI